MAGFAAMGVIGGAALSYFGQQETNQMSIDAMRESEAWQEKMSDTAMQRRVEDYRKAGLNPVLAAGGPGAMMGSPVMPSLQNPLAGASAAGGQISGALQLQSQESQIRATNAQAAKTEYETSDKLPAEVQNLQAATGLTASQAVVAQKNAELITAQTFSANADAVIEQFKEHWASLEDNVKKAMVTASLSAMQSDAQAKAYGLPQLANMSDVQKTEFGKILAYINSTVQPISSAASAVGAGVGGVLRGARSGPAQITNVRLPNVR